MMYLRKLVVANLYQFIYTEVFMSIVILGGNERMERQYVDICQKYNVKVKTFIKPVARLKNKIGEPDLMIFFTNCMSHKMVHCALDEIKGMDTRVERVQSASVASLKKILEKSPFISVVLSVAKVSVILPSVFSYSWFSFQFVSVYIFSGKMLITS